MTILTDCPSCGHIVTVDPAEATLVVFRPALGRRRLPARLIYRCPACLDRCDAIVERHEELRLVDIGVPVELTDDPRERHPSARGRRLHSGAGQAVDAGPFTEADVQALHELLSSDDWFERLLEA